MKGPVAAVLARCLCFALVLLVHITHASPSLLQPRRAAAEVIPPRSINLDELTADAYKELLETLRQELEICHRQASMHVLPPQIPNPNATTVSWFDLGLHTGQHTVTIRLQADNLYLLGFRVEGGPAPVWNAFSDAEGLIPGSHTLPGGFTYSRLETAAELRRPELTLGPAAFRGAVSYLATHPNDPSNKEEKKALAKSLLVVVQMICEALRFRLISDHVSVDNVRITERMARLENDWADISAAVLRGDTVHTPTTPLDANDDQLRKWELWTLQAAIAILGIALQPVLPSPRGKRAADIAAAAQCGMVPKGRTLLAVYFVRINNIDGEDPGDLYGSITATDALGREYLYYQDWLDSISPGQDVPLTGPPRAMSGSGSFSIDLDLWDRDRPPDITPDDEVSRGSILWNPYDPRNRYDQAHYEMISGESGSASVQYAVLRVAATAKVTVILVEGDENPDDVCGTITAATEIGEIVLFDRVCEGDKSVPVKENEPIPLMRSVAAVSMDHVLTIKAHLWDWDWLKDDEIANGNVTFSPEISREPKKTISGAYGKIDVSVIWAYK